MTLLYAAVVLVGLAILALVVQNIWTASLRRDGRYPEKAALTMADVERFAKSGEKLLAIKAYRELHDVGLKEAKDQVEFFLAHSTWGVGDQGK